MVEDVWVEVDLSALRHNLAQVRGVVGDSVKIMAVVKANGYGHGYVEPSRAFLEAGAYALGVTRLEEGLILRNAGITAPLLLFAPIQPENAQAAIEADLDMTVADLSLVLAISRSGKNLGKAPRVHVKVDTGMGRLGVDYEDAESFVKSVDDTEGVQVAGIYTHFAGAKGKRVFPAKVQCFNLRVLSERLNLAGVDYGLAHAANSAAILRLPESRFDMVRPGTLLYGQYPAGDVPKTLDLRNAWTLKSRICQIRLFPKGTPMGYGWEHITRRRTRAAIVPIGYADGFTLVPEGPVYRRSALRFVAGNIKRRPTMTVRGRKANVLGRVGMQLTAIDVTDIEDASVGDEVIVPALRIPTNALARRVYVESSK
ncbi:MAG: alanine racemase [Armatimonadetes bacterium RBG_16_58_9]|nr:MAG: alanine racemase [Armatimonadetes bacterium RBG_16_58_9]